MCVICRWCRGGRLTDLVFCVNTPTAGMGADSAGCSEMERESCHSSWRTWSHHRPTTTQLRTATRRTSPRSHVHRPLRYRSVTVLELDYLAPRNTLVSVCLSVSPFVRQHTCDSLQESCAIARRTARCRCKFWYVSNFTTASYVFPCHTFDIMSYKTNVVC